ncbi:MAG: FkbM family methyltransferase [Chloroflexi bacterium]|nr:FkbM family methyltransferase [Chloroflexota bacterium]
MTQLFDAGLTLYRKTLKRVYPIHAAIHALMSWVVIPALEALHRFRTMPDDPLWFRVELLTNRHEAETLAQLERLIEPGMTVLDIGSHVGYYARRFAQLVGAQGRVLAFEPHPRNFALLESNTARFPAVQPLQFAVGESEGRAQLYDYLIMSASGSLNYDPNLLDLQKAHVRQSDIAPRIARDFPVESFSVDVVPLDRYLGEHGIDQVQVIKMDIEGAEIGALRGLRRTIDQSPAVTLIMEFNPGALVAFNHDPLEALQEVIDIMSGGAVAIIEPNGALEALAVPSDAASQLTTRLLSDMGVVNLLIRKGI